MEGTSGPGSVISAALKNTSKIKEYNDLYKA
jgi:hypothetical protein